MSAWDYDGTYTRYHEEEGRESDLSRSVLERWHVLTRMRVRGMTGGRFRILSIIMQVCPPGNSFLKDRKRLAEEADVSQRTVDSFYPWAYEAGILDREKGRMGLSERKWPNYVMCLEYTTQSVAAMEEDRRVKAADRLAAFGRALVCDEDWEPRFRASIDREARQRTRKRTPAKPAVPPAKPAVPTPAKPAVVPPQDLRSITEVSNRTPKQKEVTEAHNGSESEQACSSGKPKSTARGKEQATRRQKGGA